MKRKLPQPAAKKRIKPTLVSSVVSINAAREDKYSMEPETLMEREILGDETMFSSVVDDGLPEVEIIKVKSNAAQPGSSSER